MKYCPHMSEEEIVAQTGHRHHSSVWGHAGMCHNTTMSEDLRIKPGNI